MRRRLAPRGATALLAVALAGLANGGWDLFRRSVRAAEEGAAALAEGDAARAVERYQAAAAEVPASAELQYDLGLAHLAAGAHDDAAAALRQAVSSPDTALRAKALCALGSVHAAKEQWQEAADAWKRALLLDPTLDDARHNYEVAWVRVHPPCAAKEDPFEDNDSPAEAKPFDPEAAQQAGGALTACAGDSDWFAVTAPAGHELRVTVRTQVAGAILATTLMAPDGSVLREAVAEGGGDKGAEAGRVARMDVSHIGEDSVFLVGAVPEGQAEEAAYTLEPVVLPPCPAGDDALEDNDRPVDARPLEKGGQALRLCAGDEDWFAVSAGEGEDLSVRVTYDAPRGALELALLDGQARRVVGESAKGTGAEGVFLEKPGGSFLVRVRGARQTAANVYQIEVSDKPPDQGDGGGQGDKDKPDEAPPKDPPDPDAAPKDEPPDDPAAAQQPPPAEEDRPPQEQDALDVLRSLQEDDRNLALERALKAAPPRRVERDW